jgi:hypothetical protein
MVDRVWSGVPQSAKRQCIGDQIDAEFRLPIFDLAEEKRPGFCNHFGTWFVPKMKIPFVGSTNVFRHQLQSRTIRSTVLCVLLVTPLLVIPVDNAHSSDSAIYAALSFTLIRARRHIITFIRFSHRQAMSRTGGLRSTPMGRHYTE